MDQAKQLNEQEHRADLIELAADVVCAYIGNNTLTVANLPALIADVHRALRNTQSRQVAAEPAPPQPAVKPKKSIFPDYIICLEDGKKFRSLKRHLRAHYDLSPDEYRDKWGLADDYPMAAPNYSAARSELAKKSGLGRQRRRR